jgi:hypothetical protein
MSMPSLRLQPSLCLRPVGVPHLGPATKRVSFGSQPSAPPLKLSEPINATAVDHAGNFWIEWEIKVQVTLVIDIVKSL